MRQRMLPAREYCLEKNHSVVYRYEYTGISIYLMCIITPTLGAPLKHKTTT